MCCEKFPDSAGHAISPPLDWRTTFCLAADKRDQLPEHRRLQQHPAVNSALARVDYLPNANYSGGDTLNISLDDQGNTGPGGAKTDSKSVAITVAVVNDPNVTTRATLVRVARSCS